MFLVVILILYHSSSENTAETIEAPSKCESFVISARDLQASANRISHANNDRFNLSRFDTEETDAMKALND
ncbi:hypothetical protein KIN20_032782 [Parelaphostrongylus tenuis]|nr:hypothetical protein KIN20_032782 [Parelaphostrongylus tenuis]